LREAVLAALIAALALSGCGPKAITVGSRPFPSGTAVFTDAAGRALTDLPDSEEPFRLVVLDFPWCPPCEDAWKSVREALETVPPGTVHPYRILFDREISLSAAGKRETAPMHSTPPPWPDPSPGGTERNVTTLIALPGVFREEFRVNQAPVLLLIGRGGTVERRWNGYSTGLVKDLSSEFRKRSPAPSALPPGR
jgi:hypothetical protein